MPLLQKKKGKKQVLWSMYSIALEMTVSILIFSVMIAVNAILMNLPMNGWRSLPSFTYSLMINCEGQCGTTDDFSISFLHFSVLHCPLGLGKLQACPFPDNVFPPLLLCALSSSASQCTLQNGFGHTWWMGDMSIPFWFASIYDGQAVSDCLLNICMDFLVGNMFFVWDV